MSTVIFTRNVGNILFMQKYIVKYIKEWYGYDVDNYRV